MSRPSAPRLVARRAVPLPVPLAVPLVVLLAALLAAACASTPRASTAPLDAEAPALDPAALARAIHGGTNRARRAAGAPTLEWDRDLADVAARHSADMARRGYFAHASPEGVRVDDRAAAAGLTCHRAVGRQTLVGFGENLLRTPRWSHVVTTTGPDGERRAFHWKTPGAIADETVAGWLDSPPHRANLLAPTHVRQGIGLAVSEDGNVYVTQIFC